MFLCEWKFKNISDLNFKYNDVFIDPSKTVEEIKIKPYSKIFI